MLYSFRKGAFALAAAVTLAGTAAQAETHSVLIVDGGFFPPVVHVQPGDEIEFTNNSESVQIITGDAESWTSGEIELDSTYLLAVNEELPHGFVAVIVQGEADAGEGDGDTDAGNEGALELYGEFTFEPAPI
ncbi:hypothetical protein [Sulfitobacter sp. JB4-11]|uniref:hypothetical protein n=1 Tax=Sulfitobacter rhodophyticola TaxID=3238304 RepID=UPI003D8173CB